MKQEKDLKLKRLRAQLRIARAMLIILLASCAFIAIGQLIKHQVQAVTGDYGKAPGSSLTSGEWNNLLSDFVDASGDTMTGPLTITGAGNDVCINGGGTCLGTVAAGASYGVIAGGGLQKAGNDFGMLNCGDTQIMKVSGGVWGCAADDGGAGGDITDVNTGAGLTGGGGGPVINLGVDTNYLQRRVDPMGCAAGSSIRLIAVDGSVTCEIDDAGAGGDGYIGIAQAHIAGGTLNMAGNTISMNNAGAEGDINQLSWLVGYNDLFIKGNSTETAPVNYTGSEHHFYIGPIPGTERLRIANSGAITASYYNCTANANGGKLTADANGNITCADDSAGAGGDGYIGDIQLHTAGGNLNMSGHWISGDGGLNEGIYIDNSGNVGIGMTPSETLHVRGWIASDAPANNPSFHLYDDDRIYTMQIHSATNRFQIYDNTASAARLTILTNGNVGLGTINPNSRLHVYQDAGANAEIDIQSVAGAGNHWGIYHDRATDELRFWQGSDLLTLTNAGNLTAAGQICDTNGCIGAGAGLWTAGAAGQIYYDVPDPDVDRVGINTNNPQTQLHINAAASGGVRIDEAGVQKIQLYTVGGHGVLQFIEASNNSILRGNGRSELYSDLGIKKAPVAGIELDVQGEIQALDFIFASDISLKENIKPIEGALEKIMKLNGVEFAWKESGERNIGLIAQDVEEIFPDAVFTDVDSGLKSLKYGNLVAPLIEAVKEQQAQIEELRAEIEELKNK